MKLINLEKKNDVIASVCKVMCSELEASVEEESRSKWAMKNQEIKNDINPLASVGGNAAPDDMDNDSSTNNVKEGLASEESN